MYVNNPEGITKNWISVERQLIKSLAQAVLDPLDMPTAHALNLAAQFEIGAYLFIIEHAEAVDDGKRPSHCFEHFRRIELEVFLMPNRKHDCIYVLHGFPQVTLDSKVLQLVLSMEKP